MSAPTHRERAERAAQKLRLGLSGENATSRMIARETHPTELVDAAKGIAHSNQCWTQESWDAALDQLESALALYEETP